MPFKCFQIEKKTITCANDSRLDYYNNDIDFYREYLKINNDNDNTIKKLKETIYEIYNMNEKIKILEEEIGVNNSLCLEK